ncbi:hypothetical protein UF64_13865, partial [Thalassospira sp. HJ]
MRKAAQCVLPYTLRGTNICYDVGASFHLGACVYAGSRTREVLMRPWTFTSVKKLNTHGLWRHCRTAGRALTLEYKEDIAM